MKVVLQNSLAPDGSHYRFLTVGRAYEVLAIESDWYRLLDDASEPILFDPACFNVVDPREPGFWICTHGAEGERYAYPPGWNVRGFFEAWHDRVDIVREVFAAQLPYWYPEFAK